MPSNTAETSHNTQSQAESHASHAKTVGSSPKQSEHNTPAKSEKSATSSTPPTQSGGTSGKRVSAPLDNIVVHVELAGVRPEDIQLEVTNDTLVLGGRRERSEEHDEGGVRRSERVYGSFYRAIPLPEGTDPDKAR